MKTKKVLDKTSDSRTYKLTQRKNVWGCIICAPRKGCNSYNKREQRTWKKFRKTQYKPLN